MKKIEFCRAIFCVLFYFHIDMIGFELEVAKLDTIRELNTTQHEISKLWVEDLGFNGFVSYSG